jgi:hypothetical protein
MSNFTFRPLYVLKPQYPIYWRLVEPQSWSYVVQKWIFRAPCRERNTVVSHLTDSATPKLRYLSLSALGADFILGSLTCVNVPLCCRRFGDTCRVHLSPSPSWFSWTKNLYVHEQKPSLLTLTMKMKAACISETSTTLPTSTRRKIRRT